MPALDGALSAVDADEDVVVDGEGEGEQPAARSVSATTAPVWVTARKRAFGMFPLYVVPTFRSASGGRQVGRVGQVGVDRESGSDMTITIRIASASDASALTQLGARTFRDTFEDSNTPEDMARYLAGAFTPEQQAAEIADPSGIVLVAEHATGVDGAGLIGYAQLVSGEAPAPVRGPAPMELKRLYVDRAWHGRGVAQSLMNAGLDAARARGAQTMWLGVWERNPRAQAFYAKYGFERVGEHTFVLGDDAQTDWLFARPLGEA